MLSSKKRNKGRSKEGGSSAKDQMMSFWEHIQEMKHRLIKVLGWFLVCFLVLYGFCDAVINSVMEPGVKLGYVFIAVSPQEVLIQSMRVCGILAFVLSLPLFIREVFMFISPAFEGERYKGVFYRVMGASGFLVICGMCFGYFLLFPMTCGYLMGVTDSFGVSAQISIEKYVSLFMVVEMCMGVVFQIPLVCWYLVKMGVVSVTQLRKIRPEVVVIILVVAAFITPPDVISQCVVALPMLVLYEISVGMCRFAKRG